MRRPTQFAAGRQAPRPIRTAGPAPLAAPFSGTYRWTTITILAGTVISSMDAYIVNTSMPRVLGDLGQPEFYAWVASAFVLAQVVGLSVGGAWKDRVGVRTPFILSLAAFAVCALACSVAPSMPLLVLARAFQGLAGGGLSAVVFAAAASYPGPVRLRMLSLISGVWGVVALSAPLLGGLITDALGWRWIFLVSQPVYILVLLLGWIALVDSQRPVRRALPVGRAVLLALAVSGLTAAPSATRELGIVLFVIGVLAAVAFGRAERRAAEPVIPRETWLGRGAAGSSLQAMAFFTAAFSGASVFLPLYLVQMRGQSTTQAGVALGIAGFMWTVASIFAAGRSGLWPTRLARLGACMLALASASVALEAYFGTLPIVLIYVLWAAAGSGIGLAMLHLTNWSISFSPASQSGSVSAAVQTMRMMGGAAGGALMGAVLNALGSDPGHLRGSIAAVFALSAVLALWPATLGRPKIPTAG
jgi:MFS family permease